MTSDIPNIKQSLDEENINSQISDMVAKKLLTDKEASVVDVKKIEQFFLTGNRPQNEKCIRCKKGSDVRN